MKKLILFLILFTTIVFAQSKDNSVIKVYLEDAENGKNIADAKVTLEGFEIPAITGKYNKKGKFYYFDSIPKGYNTVMAYHKKYNEKGFQDIEGLPKEIKLELQDYRFVSYTFDRPVLKSVTADYIKSNAYLRKIYKRLEKEDSITNKNYEYLYSEDPFHIAIITKYKFKDFFSNDSIINLLNSLSLEQTNYKSGTNESDFTLNCYGIDTFGFYESKRLEKDVDYYCENDFAPDAHYVYFFHKKDLTKFNRYNCKEIQELRKHHLAVAVLTKRIIEYFGKSKFNNKSYDKLYDYFIRYGVFQDGNVNYSFGSNRKAYQIFLESSKKENKMYYGNQRFRIGNEMPGDERIESLFFLIPKNYDSDIGLGAFDYSEENIKTFKENFYFFNSLENIHLNTIADRLSKSKTK